MGEKTQSSSMPGTGSAPSAPLYMVLFIGELRHGVKSGTLKEAIAKKFKVSVARIDKLFTGRPEIVKNNVSKELGEKYAEALKALGAVSWVEPMPPFYGKYVDRRKNSRTRRSTAAKNQRRIGKHRAGSDRRDRPGRRYHDR